MYIKSFSFLNLMFVDDVCIYISIHFTTNNDVKNERCHSACARKRYIRPIGRLNVFNHRERREKERENETVHSPRENAALSTVV